ncbi:MAG: alkaline phosphatase family protein [Bacteroidota bacterium]
MRIVHAIVLLAILIGIAPAQRPGDANGGILLPNGWSLTPAGTQVGVGDLPMNAVLTEDERLLAVVHGGQSKAELRVLLVADRTTTQTIRLKDAFWGMARDGSRLFVSGGYQDCIYTFRFVSDTLIGGDTLRLPAHASKRGMGVAGLDVRENTLGCVTRLDSTLHLIGLADGRRRSVKLEAMPYACVALGDDRWLVSLWGGKKIVAYHGTEREFECPSGDHPNEITVSADGSTAFVACANDNTVSLVDLRGRRTIASVSTAIHPDAPEGSTTNSVAFVPGTSLVLAANADNNALAVVDVRTPARPSIAGFIPVGWYPTKVMTLRDGSILVLNGKGGRSLANPQKQYIGGLFPGSCSFIPFPSPDALEKHTKQVFANTPYRQEQLAVSPHANDTPIPRTVGGASPIKHVFYIIRENRTYDQVFGDMKEGNGDTSLCIFGEKVTPNAHALARQFVLFDNFYVNAEVSADGHNWSDGAYATDYVEKTWPPNYGGRGGKYDFEGDEPTARPSSGYLWTACAKKGLTYRTYGEWVATNDSVGLPGRPKDVDLEKNFSPTYRGWDMEYSDLDRAAAWEKEFAEFERNGELPNLSILHLPNDHTSGTRRGALTPRALVAQNDRALGLIVERITKSRFWKETAIFVVEDDAQDGPDHVDAHRSVAFVISPYAKRGFVDRTLYSTTSMLRTMELILGLPPMSQYDAAATPMANAFMKTPTPAGFSALRATWDLEERNPAKSFGEDLMDTFDLSEPDAAPDRAFNEVIWASIKGTTMPAPRYSVFSRITLEDNLDDDLHQKH